ncbi:PEP-utilizing enzyme [Actinomadura sp. GTD37]|uniref:PEP-utilizing enzyme n=1 Tax=Actinomadura sp. GTD37 TaxID=1778030 RepID=UPI0035C1808B
MTATRIEPMNHTCLLVKGSVASHGLAAAHLVIYTDGRFAIGDTLREAIVYVRDAFTPEIAIRCQLEHASGIITSRGGILSHAASLTREAHIPCLMGVGNLSDIGPTTWASIVTPAATAHLWQR